jgi:hypothetical protein
MRIPNAACMALIVCLFAAYRLSPSSRSMNRSRSGIKRHGALQSRLQLVANQAGSSQLRYEALRLFAVAAEGTGVPESSR